MYAIRSYYARCLLPIGGDGITEGPLFENLASGIDREADRADDVEQNLRIADVARVDEIGAIERVVQRLAAFLGLGPLAELLGKAAIVGVGPLS